MGPWHHPRGTKRPRSFWVGVRAALVVTATTRAARVQRGRGSPSPGTPVGQASVEVAALRPVTGGGLGRRLAVRIVARTGIVVFIVVLDALDPAGPTAASCRQGWLAVALAAGDAGLRLRRESRGAAGKGPGQTGPQLVQPAPGGIDPAGGDGRAGRCRRDHRRGRRTGAGKGRAGLAKAGGKAAGRDERCDQPPAWPVRGARG
jgi:hypothetical protein